MSQDQLVDSKMMVESKAVAFVTLLMVWQQIESPLSWRMKKSGPYTMSLYFVGVVIKSATVIQDFLFVGGRGNK